MKIKNCPICGNAPIMHESSLDDGKGHGYPGCSTIQLVCPHCGLPQAKAVNNIYDTSDLYARAIESWNNEVQRIEQLLKEK